MPQERASILLDSHTGLLLTWGPIRIRTACACHGICWDGSDCMLEPCNPGLQERVVAAVQVGQRGAVGHELGGAGAAGGADRPLRALHVRAGQAERPPGGLQAARARPQWPLRGAARLGRHQGGVTRTSAKFQPIKSTPDEFTRSCYYHTAGDCSHSTKTSLTGRTVSVAPLCQRHCFYSSLKGYIAGLRPWEWPAGYWLVRMRLECYIQQGHCCESPLRVRAGAGCDRARAPAPGERDADGQRQHGVEPRARPHH